MSANTIHTIHPSSDSGDAHAADAPNLRWRPLDIAVAAALGAACGVIFWGFDFAYMPISSVLGAVLPGLASVTHAMWYFSGTLALLVLRKPGAATYVNVVGTLVETVIGSQYGIGFVIVSALLQGLFAEIPFALTRYRRFTLPVAVASGLLVALEYGLYLLFFRYQGVSIASPRGIVHMISELTGGALLSGVMPWFLMLGLAKTGVLDRLASGRALLGRHPAV
ncbi:ECF transporter S component [Bifidobacterium saguinibicoloris]|uniref:ECF transporter S component n=1 Tax=Bifidobacterium saguinibicoloris TaxID=2834433 RepID=UPI001C5868A1|nr:ECF transporter S component [Bifidobacterium saguinibicoloris]MBW3080393.1 ECF transporter S component [Bifidobacterium saguinibicoloris]